MKQLIRQLEISARAFNKKYVFGKVNVNNLASYMSFVHSGYNEFSKYDKTVKRGEFQAFLSSGLLKPATLSKAEISLASNANDIVVKYAILIKSL